MPSITTPRNPNRAARRQNRGSVPTGGGPKFSAGLAGVLVVAALAIGGVAYMNRSLVGPSITATPTPNSDSATTGTQLIDGQALGAVVFASGDATGGGVGQAVDGVSCASQEYAAYHVHAHLSLFVRGKQIAIPSLVGIVQGAGRSPCLYWMHTHDSSGIVHIESPYNGAFTLGQFFDIWGMTLGSQRVASFNGRMRAYVNGTLYTGDPHTIPLVAHQEITLEVGSPTLSPPRYIFPARE